VVQVLLLSGALVATDNSFYNNNDFITTNYYADLIYTALTGCPSHWTTTTAVLLYVPGLRAAYLDVDIILSRQL